MKHSIMLLIAAVAAGAAALVTAPAGLNSNDTVNWSAVGGAAGSTHASPWTVASSGGVSVTLSETGSFGTGNQTGTTIFASPTFFVNNQYGGPVTVGFSTPLSGFGLDMANNFGGAFTASIQAFNGSTSLGTFSVNQTLLNKAIFLGVTDTTADITKVVLSLTAGPGDNYILFDNLLLTAPAAGSATPEPASGLLVVGAAGIVAGIRRIRKMRCR